MTDGAPHPCGDVIRPTTAIDHGEDGAGYWVGFWEVTDLQRLDVNQWVKTSRLMNLRGRRFSALVPAGPVLLGTDPVRRVTLVQTAPSG